MERKLSQQLRSFQELPLRETRVDKGTNLLSALKNFASFSGTPFYRVLSYLCFQSSIQPAILFKKKLIRDFFKNFCNTSCEWLLQQKKKPSRLFPQIISEAAVLSCSKIFEKRKHLQWSVFVSKIKKNIRIYYHGSFPGNSQIFQNNSFLEHSRLAVFLIVF